MDVLMVGIGLDTNGQKHRFVEAARRWGSDPTVTKALIAGSWDGAGIPARLAVASSKGGRLVIRSAHRSTAYFDFPLDIRWDNRTHAEVQRLAEEADVLHLTNDVKAYFQLRQAKNRKPALLHHHGTLFRSQHDRLLAEARRFHMVQAVSTLDLKRYAPDELHWLPAPIDLKMMADIRRQGRRPADGLIRIVSSPTNRDLKSTVLLEAAVRQLQGEGLPVELVLVEGRTWAECLAVKATADIYFDQVAVPSIGYPGGYGCNAIEAWGMAIPVVAGADEWTTNAMHGEWGTRTLPYHEATEGNIADRLRELVVDEHLRATVGQRGLKHARKYHDEKPALQRLAHLYGLAIAAMAPYADEPSVEEFPLAPGVFETTKHPRLQVRVMGSHYVRFEEGRAEVSDPVLAQGLRKMARWTPRHQITEVFGDTAA